MALTNVVLAEFFRDASRFCGSENVLHVQLHHCLIQGGLSPADVEREYRVGTTLFDLAVHDHKAGPAGAEAQPQIAIEIKGGAYNTRNALKDEVDEYGYCSDLAKLKTLAHQGVEAWMIFVDMPELGRAVGPVKLGLVEEQCGKHGVSMAYFCQGEPYAQLKRIGSPMERLPVGTLHSIPQGSCLGDLYLTQDNPLSAAVQALLPRDMHEANLAAALYRCLRHLGHGPNQLSLETYFSFAKTAGSRMHDRPDLVVFDDGFDGRFNLFKSGSVNRSNDLHKLAHMTALFEIKGGGAMNRSSDRALMNAYRADIKKLLQWRELARRSYTRLTSTFAFIGADGRTKGLSEDAVHELRDQCREHDLGLAYLRPNGVVTQQPQSSNRAMDQLGS